jgi:hypothetical protein
MAEKQAKNCFFFLTKIVTKEIFGDEETASGNANS